MCEAATERRLLEECVWDLVSVSDSLRTAARDSGKLTPVVALAIEGIAERLKYIAGRLPEK